VPNDAPVEAVGGAALERPGRSRALGLIRACHPGPTAVVTVLITALAAASGRGAIGCAMVALAVLSGQLSIGWCNDRVDLRRDIAANRRDKPLVTGEARPGDVTMAAGCALAACLPLSLANGLLAGAAHLTGVAAAWCYNLGVKRTVISWLPYAIAFGLLPAFLTLALQGRPWPPAWAVAAGALLGVGAHLTNVLPDIDADLAAGVRGLPQRLGRRRAGALAVLLLLGASTVLVLGPPGAIGPAGWSGLAAAGALAIAAVTLPGTGGSSRAPFVTTMALAAVDIAVLLLRGSALS